jgi:autophagy-related protein 13
VAICLERTFVLLTKLQVLSLSKTYLQCVMARTLYSYVRVLPAYRLYRACRDHRGEAYNLTYRLLHKPASLLPAVDAGQADGGPKRWHVERFAFAPIETMTGSLQISVQYQPHVAPLPTAATVPVSIPQHVITDYIRAPSMSSAPSSPLLTCQTVHFDT